MQDARLQIQGALDLWRAVDGIRSGACRGEGGPGLGQVTQCVVGFALQQLDLDQEILVVQLLQLPQKLSAQSQGFRIQSSIEI